MGNPWCDELLNNNLDIPSRISQTNSMIPTAQFSILGCKFDISKPRIPGQHNHEPWDQQFRWSTSKSGVICSSLSWMTKSRIVTAFCNCFRFCCYSWLTWLCLLFVHRPIIPKLLLFHVEGQTNHSKRKCSHTCWLWSHHFQIGFAKSFLAHLQMPLYVSSRMVPLGV